MAYVKKRPELDYCPVEAVVALVGGRWKARLLDHIANGADVRLGALNRAMPAAPRQVLVQPLEAMEQDGLITVQWRTQGATRFRVYGLTGLGREVHAVLAPLAACANQRLRGSPEA